MTVSRPASSEFAPYYQKYVDLVTEADLLDVLRGQPDELRRVAEELGEARADHRYEPGKWSVKQVVSHIADTERIFAYRILRISRGDATPLPGFDENVYAERSNVEGRTLASLVDAFDRLRRANMDLFEEIDAEMVDRVGTANGLAVSARALLYITAGHARHHLRLLESRYR